MKKTVFLLLFTFCTLLGVNAQGIGASPEYIKAITPEWKGERFPDGRPKVSDNLLERAKKLPLEAIWGALRNLRYQNQFQGEWHIIHPEESMSGRAVTAQYMPSRPDMEVYIKEQGIREKRAQQGGTNSWPIDVLVEGDIYVADSYGKIIDGTLIGDNLGNSIFAKSKRGVVFYGGVRDEEGLAAIEGFNGWILGADPSYIMNMMLTSINTPVRIGRATVLPGDLVVAKKFGVIFIPAHIAEEVIITSEVTELRDQFGHQRLREGKYKPGEIDSAWSDAIKADFKNWLDKRPGGLPMPKAELDEYFKQRNW